MATDTLTFGSFYFSTPAGTTLSTSTPAKASGTTSSISLSGFTHTSNRLTYTAATTRTFHALATISMSSSGATNSIVHLYKDGTLITGSSIERKISTGGDIGAIAVSVTVSMAQNEYVEIWLENDDGDTMTIEAGTLVIKVLG